MSAVPGWLGRLELEFERAPHGTQLRRSSHEGPLRIQRVFQPEGAACPHVYLLHPPGGVVGGDRLLTHVRLGAGAQVLLTTPAAQKLYRSSGKTAEVANDLDLAAGASLDWLPSETLAFPAAEAQLVTRVHLASGAAFIGWDVICYGMPARGEAFDRGRVLSRFELYRDQQPLLLESLDLEAGRALLESAFGLRGQPVVGNLYAVPESGVVSEELVTAVRRAVGENTTGQCAVTSLGDALVVRALGPNVEGLRHQLIQAWQMLRPLVLERQAVLPRVWST